MPHTPNNMGGPFVETEYAQFYDSYGAIPTETGTLAYHDGYFYMRDAYGVFNPRQGGTGLSEGEHENLDTLVHEIDETSYDEITYVGGMVSSYIVWTSAAKELKVREETYTYVSGKVSQVVTKQYDDLGVVKMTMTENYTYSGSRVLTVTRVKS